MDAHDVNCRDFEQKLERLLSGELPPDAAARVEAHRADCTRCARLLDIVRGQHVPDDMADDAFVAALLEKTVGSACGRAEAQLCAWVDGELDAVDAALVAQHVEHCDACATLAVTLRALAHDLADMAEIDPGAAFTRHVLERTSRAARQPAHGWITRLRDEWQALLLRPRAALELATAGSLVLVLLCGLPFSPMREMPRQALHLAQVNPVAVAAHGLGEAQPLWSDYVVPAWDASGARLVERAQSAAESFTASRPHAVAAWDSLQTHTAEVGHGLWERDGARVARALQAAGTDVQLLWDGLRDAAPAPRSAEPQPSEG